MPVTIYAKIKMRRGLQEDLPNLGSGEFGYALNTGRLFIGRGDLSEGALTTGNNEILTQHSNSQSIINYKYSSNNAFIPNYVVDRTLEQTLNDYISVKAFGAKGDGVSDDSDAINNAISEIYNNYTLQSYPNESKWKKIFFPAGKYIINNPIKLPPFTNIFGEGNGRTVINYNGIDDNFIAETVDNLFQQEIQIGTNTSLPSNIIISDLTMSRNNLGNIININRTSNITFSNVEFIGGGIYNLAQPDTNGIINLQTFGNVISISEININNCSFNNAGFIIKGDMERTHNVKIQNTSFNGFYSGLNITNTHDWSISSCSFSNIEQDDISISNSSNIQTHNNNYSKLIIDNDSHNCSSLLDNGTVDCLNKSSIVVSTTSDLILQNVLFSTKRGPIELLPNMNGQVVASFPSDASGIFIDYTLITSGIDRIGSIKISNLNNNLNITDVFSSLTPDNITFDAVYGNGNIVNLICNSTDGSPAYFQFMYRQF